MAKLNFSVTVNRDDDRITELNICKDALVIGLVYLDQDDLKALARTALGALPKETAHDLACDFILPW